MLQAKARIFTDGDWHHEYRPSALGSNNYRDLSTKLLFGPNHRLLLEKRYKFSNLCTKNDQGLSFTGLLQRRLWVQVVDAMLAQSS